MSKMSKPKVKSVRPRRARAEVCAELARAACRVNQLSKQLRDLYGDLPIGEGEIPTVAQCVIDLERVRDSLLSTFGISLPDGEL